MKSFEQIAKAMYAAYRRHIQTVIGVNPPSWGDLPMTELQAWISAAQEANKEIAEVH